MKHAADEASPSDKGTAFSSGPSVRGSALGRLLGAGKTRAPRRPRRPNPLAVLLNSWWDRLLGAVTDGGFSQQEEEYAAHRTSRDYLWNTVGLTAWGMVFPALTVVVTQLSGVERAGMFSLAFVTAHLLFYLGGYGVRTYQVSDLDGAHSFADYQIHRVLTCALMLVAGYLYCLLRGYGAEMLALSLGVYAYKAVDALGDVYEGRLQQRDKLYLGGISQTVRSVFALVVFSVLLVVTGSLVTASIGMAVAALVTFLFVTFPLALLETPKSSPASAASVARLFKQCAPLFVALFMYALVDNMPKFVMEGALSYDNQLYFNALYFPAQAVLLTAGFLYKPLLVRMAATWADVTKRHRFDLFILAMMAIIAGIALAAAAVMNWIGIPVLGVLYGLDFEQHRALAAVMVAAGGVTAGIDFLYQVITILRRQKVVTELYVITFGFSLLILLLLVNMTGLEGAVIGYLVVMSILFVLLVREYVSVRIAYARHPEQAAGTKAEAEQGAGAARGFAGGAFPQAMTPMQAQPSVEVPASAARLRHGAAAADREDARRRLRARRTGADVDDPAFNDREDARQRLADRLNRQ